MKEFKNGLLTGLTLQLAIGPVFFYIVNLELQKSIFDGFAGVLGVTSVDYIYITLAILGIGSLLKNKKFKNIFGAVSSFVLIIFGLLILQSALSAGMKQLDSTSTSNLLQSFSSVFLLTISSPMTIVFFTSLFTAKAVEYSYTKKELYLFGLGTGFATFLFMGSSVVIFSLIRNAVPTILIQILNGIVGGLLVGYGSIRFYKVLLNR